MAVTYVAGAVANNGQTVGTNTAAFTVPASAQAGDTAIVSLQQNSGSATFTPPSGWTRLSGPDYTNSNIATVVYAKDLVAGDLGGTASFTSSVSARLPGIMDVFRGTATSLASLTYAQLTAAGTTLTSPTITTTAAGTGIYNIWGPRSGFAAPSPTITVPANHTAVSVSASQFATAPNAGMQGSYLTTPGAAGSYGGQTATSSGSVTANNYTIALPASTVTGTLNTSGSGSAGFTQSAMTVTGASATMSGSNTLGLSGSPTMPGSLGVSGSSSLSLLGSPAMSGAMATSGSATVSFTQPVGGSLALTGAGALSLSGVGQLYIFAGPSIYEYAPFQPFTARWSRLVFEIAYGQTVWRAADGTWHQQYAPTADQLAGALAVYPGGRVYHLTDQQLADLTAGGYGGYITLENMP